MIVKLKAFLDSLQDSEGKFTTNNPLKSTAEYLLVNRFCPDIGVGDPGKARTYLIDNLPLFAEYQVKKGFTLMEKIWQIAVGIPEDTVHLSDHFLQLCTRVTDSVKSSLLLVLLLQNINHDLTSLLKEVITYQKELYKTISPDSLYETTHNLMTFYVAQQKYDIINTINESCTWLSHHIFSFSNCIDLMAETASVSLLCGYHDEHVARILSALPEHQNEDGGIPVYVNGKSEFHASLVTLWALTGCTENHFQSF